MSTFVRFIGHFARNRQLRTAVKSPVDVSLKTDLQLWQEVVAEVGNHLIRATPLGDSSLDDPEPAFAAAIMYNAELTMPLQERMMPG